MLGLNTMLARGDVKQYTTIQLSSQLDLPGHYQLNMAGLTDFNIETDILRATKWSYQSQYREGKGEFGLNI